MDKGTNVSFDVLFNNASMGILLVNEQGTIVLVNPFLLKQFGYTEEELLGQPIEKLIPARFHHRHKDHVKHYNEHPRNRPMGLGMDLFGTKKSGEEFPVEVSLGNHETENGRFVIAFLSDISRRKEAELALKHLNEELEHKIAERTLSLTGTVEQLAQAETDLRMALEKEKELSELKSRFVSLASHEFRTPLSTVLSSAYLISKYVEATDHHKREKHVQRIVSSVNMLTDILNDFLSVGRIEEGKIHVRYTTFDIEQHIRQIIPEMNGLRKKEQDIQYSHEGGSLVELDPSLLKHIVMNLLSNAIKFSPEKAEINLYTKKTDEIFTVSCKDQGLGISKEDQQHLFERFFRGANVTNIQGTGLGLHIIAKYAELMNGEVSFHSELNEGTTFEIVFHLKNQH